MLKNLGYEVYDGGLVIDDPAPQLPSLEVFPDSCTVEEFAQKVSGQHVLVVYGDITEEIKDFCKLMDIEIVM